MFNVHDQVSQSFVLSQVTRINTRVYEIKYPAVQYRELVPVDTTGPEWVKSITYFSNDAVGQAQWMNAGADDVPRAELIRNKTEMGVSMAAIGYGWNIEELAQAQMLGINLADRKAVAARRVSEEFIDNVAFFGDAQKGYTGAVNNPSVTAGSAAATGTGSTTTWSTKTPDQILFDINTALSGIFDSTLTTEMADTLLIPETQYTYITTTRLDTYNPTTIYDWITRNNLYTVRTGRPLTIRSLRRLNTAGSGGTARMVAYRNSEEVLRLNLPMPFRFFEPMRQGPFRWDVPGAFRVGGVDVSLPGAMRYVDGI